MLETDLVHIIWLNAKDKCKNKLVLDELNTEDFAIRQGGFIGGKK